MKQQIKYIATFLTIIFSISSCCIGAKEDYLGNNIYLSEYDIVDRRILYQTESCAVSGVEIVPMTVLEISHDNKWIIAKSGNKRIQTGFKYWVIKNDYESIPDSKKVKENTIEFSNIQQFEKFLVENEIDLVLEKID
jgi:hypothetical protein